MSTSGGSAESYPEFRMATTNAVGAAGIVVIAVYPFVFAVFHIAKGDIGIAVFPAVLSVASVFVALRLALVNVSARPKGVYVRNTFSRLTIPWVEIDHFELGHNDPFAIVGIAVLRDGRRIGMHAIQPPNRLTRPRNRFAQDAIASLNRLLAERATAPP